MRRFSRPAKDGDAGFGSGPGANGPSLNNNQSAIRGDPEAALLWVSRSQRHLARALAERGFSVGQKLVGRLLKRLGFSLQANSKTREGASHPDRDAQFEHINAQVQAFQAEGQPAISVEVVHPHRLGLTFGPQLAPGVQPWDHQRHGGLCRGEHPALVA